MKQHEKYTPVTTDRLQQILARLLLHYPLNNQNEHSFKQHYMNALKYYPEDLLCAAYMHIIKHSQTMPDPCDFIAFMEPEMQYRMQKNVEEVVA